MTNLIETSKGSEESKQSIVLILDDDPNIIKSFQENFSALDLKVDLIPCINYREYTKTMAKHRDFVKCLIMDLSNNTDEDVSHVFKSTSYIEEEYHNNRIPIFIHSANLSHFDKLDDKGTIIKKPKGRKAIAEICNSIQLMQESGFLDIFCLGGTLDQKIMGEIHKAFVNQFKPNEVEGIIKSIKDSKSGNFEERTKEVFERIALRAVYQNVISNSESFESIKVNSIEHYYRRTDGKDFYTGDVFVKKDDGQLVFVATPRCNLSNKNYEQVLLCQINPLRDDQIKSFLSSKIENKESGETKGLKQLRTNITDDVTNSFIGERFRFLPKTPQFGGGFVDCMRSISIEPKSFIENYSYAISLIDDLTNDVIRKLAGYILRGGISDTAYLEAIYYFQEIEENKKANQQA